MPDDVVRCPACKKAFKNEVSIVGDQLYHPACLKCGVCSNKLKETCFETDSKLVCKTCYTSKYSPKCARCQKTMEGKTSELLGKMYHPACPPVCHRCQKPPSDGQYVAAGDKTSCLECHWTNVRDERRKQMQQSKPKTSQASAVSTK